MHLLYILSFDISIPKIAFIAILHYFILLFLILFIYLQHTKVHIKSTVNDTITSEEKEILRIAQNFRNSIRLRLQN